MFHSSFFPQSYRVAASLLLVGVFFTSGLYSATKYDIRAQTKDKVTTYIGKAKQGSFGAPTLNDKGSIAYPCIVFGNAIDAFTNGTILFRKKGKKAKTSTAIQTGAYILDNSFLPGYPGANTYGVVSSAYIYKISKAIAINNKNQVGFAAEVLNEVRNDTYQNGVLTNSTYRQDDRSDYGCVFPSATALGGYQNACLSIYENYFAEILQRTLSINQTGSVPENATYRLTPTHSVPGFDYSYPFALTTTFFQDGIDFVEGPYYTSDGAIVATTESNVIGLPYETVFSAFSDAIIANGNRVFVVADISDTGDEFDGIWQGTNPNLQPIVVKQTPAPGGGTFTSFDGKVGPNRKGTSAAFIANLTGGKATRGVFRSDVKGKKVDLIASLGAKAPGTTGTFSTFDLAAVNNRGKVAILGSATGGGGANGRPGIWLSDSTGKNLQNIIIVGQKLKVGKKMKQVSHIAFNPVAAINQKGQVAFTASFTDRTSAVIVATAH